MRHHEIELNELVEWMAEKTVDFASSTRENKRLKITLQGNFIVTVGDKIVYQGTQPFSAVEAYNGITEKYPR